MDLKTALQEKLENALNAYLEAQGVENPGLKVMVEEPRNPDHGDLATNLAMQLPKLLRRKPLDIAGELLEHFDKTGLVQEATVAPPGFINFRLEPASAAECLRKIAAQGKAYGRAETARPEKVLVEFVSANPTGPLHIGHARNAVVGDCLARLLDAAGYDVTREYYFNDAGVQMNMLGNTLRLRVQETLGHEVEWPEPKVDENGEAHAQYYKGEYMVEIAQKMVAEEGESAGAERPLSDYTAFAVREIIAMIDADLKAMGIAFDNWFSETTLHENGAVQATLEELRNGGKVYEKEKAQWIRTTEYGDEKDRVVVKSDGNYTYVMPDIAYHRDKYARGYDRLINVLGGDHHGYVPRLRAAVASLGHPMEALQCVIIQMVSLLKDGETLKLSTRAGKFITLKEMIDELGVGVVRYFFAMRSPDSQMVFDWALARDTSMDNPVYYVQYAHARCHSLFRKAGEEGCPWEGVEGADLALLAHPAEQAILRTLGRFPEVVESAAADLAPHYVTQYLHELAQHFHVFFTLGSQDPTLRFILPDQPALTQARLSLIHGLKTTLANGLELLGIPPMERM